MQGHVGPVHDALLSSSSVEPDLRSAADDATMAEGNPCVLSQQMSILSPALERGPSSHSSSSDGTIDVPAGKLLVKGCLANPTRIDLA
jgi:hypothetical protein